MRKAYDREAFKLLPWELDKEKDSITDYFSKLLADREPSLIPGEKIPWIPIQLFEDKQVIVFLNQVNSKYMVGYKVQGRLKQEILNSMDKLVEHLYDNLFYQQPFTKLPWKETDKPVQEIVKETPKKVEEIIPKASGSKENEDEKGSKFDLIGLIMSGLMGGSMNGEVLGKIAGKEINAFLKGLGGEVKGEDMGKKLVEFFSEMGTGITEVAEIMGENKTSKELESLILTGNDKDKKPLILSSQVQEDLEEFMCIVSNLGNENNTGISIPKGYILQGPPGCGKTSIMKYIASSLPQDKAVVFRIEPSFYRSPFLSLGEKGIGKLLESISKYATAKGVHAIIFMDEFEDIARSRNSMHEAYAKELNVLLRFLDGLKENSNVTFFGATNIGLTELDPAILRGGRCSQVIRLDKPGESDKNKFITDFFSDESKKGYLGIFNVTMFSKLVGPDYNYGDIKEILEICLRKLYVRRQKTKNNKVMLGKEDIESAISSFNTQRGICKT